MALVMYVLGDCPSCGGRETFGNIDIYNTHILRGCKICRYKERIPLPPVQKKILYLDQFFLSHAFRGSEIRFIRAAERIKHLTALQLLVVPYSTIHEDETHQWERHADLLSFIKRTSGGHKFRPAYDVVITQLQKAFNAWLSGGPPEYMREDSDSLLDNVHVWDGYVYVDVGRYLGDKDLIRDLKEQSVQELVRLFDEWRQSKSSFEEDMMVEHEAAAIGYWNSYFEWVQQLAQGDDNALLDAPIRSQVVARLLRQVPECEPFDQRLRKVAEFLASEHFRQTPYQDLSARIFASLKAMVKGGAYTNTNRAQSRLSGFFYDVDHIATYAPYCDAFVVDRPMSEIVTRSTVSINERYGVKIFSLINWEEMLSWFDELEASMTAEHKRALAEANPRN